MATNGTGEIDPITQQQIQIGQLRVQNGQLIIERAQMMQRIKELSDTIATINHPDHASAPEEQPATDNEDVIDIPPSPATD